MWSIAQVLGSNTQVLRVLLDYEYLVPKKYPSVHHWWPWWDQCKSVPVVNLATLSLLYRILSIDAKEVGNNKVVGDNKVVGNDKVVGNNNVAGNNIMASNTDLCVTAWWSPSPKGGKAG